MTTDIAKWAVGLTTAFALSACGEPTSPGQAANSSADTVLENAVVPLATLGKADGVEITITSVKTAPEVGPSGSGARAEPGETFVIVGYTLKNTAGKPLALMERPALSLIDGAGQRYAVDDLASAMANVAAITQGAGVGADLNPNTIAEEKTAWRVEAKAFDKATWRLVAATDPQLTFSLQ